MWNRNNDADYYRREAEEAQERIASIRREQEQEQERQNRLAELREQGERYTRSADDWTEAFPKQRNLYQREMRTDDGIDLIRYFQRGIEVVDRGEQLYNQEMDAIAQQIGDLEMQIALITQAALDRVASQIEQEFSDDQDAITHSNVLAKALRVDEPSEWLNW